MSGNQCCENPPHLSSNSGNGEDQEIGGLSCYVSSAHQDSKLAVVLISDVYGYEAPKLRNLADKVASAGYYTVVPDFFYGDPYKPGEKKPLSDWLKNHDRERGCEDAKQVIDALKGDKGISKIGACGFCWGGTVATKLARTDYIQAAVVLHPGPIPEDEVKDVKAPIAILGAETDEISPPEHLKKLGDVLSAREEVESFVKIFPGVVHGWTVRYRDDDEFEARSAREAHSDMLNWLQKYLK